MPYGNRDGVIAEWRWLLGAQSYQTDFNALEEELYSVAPADDNDVSLTLAFETKLDEIKARIRLWATGKTAPDPKDRRFLSFLVGLKPETLDRLDTWFPEDSLQVVRPQLQRIAIKIVLQLTSASKVNDLSPEGSMPQSTFVLTGRALSWRTMRSQGPMPKKQMIALCQVGRVKLAKRVAKMLSGVI
jgi:hypothetical protein